MRILTGIKTAITRRQNRKFFGWIIFVCLLSGHCYAQKAKPFLPLKSMPEQFRKQLKKVNSEFKFAYGMRLDSVMREIRNYKPEDIRAFIHKEKEYEKIFRCPFWMATDSARLFSMMPELISNLTDTTYVGLTDANDVTIWCRIKTGQLVQNSANYQIDDDIFKVCGRANWILKRLTKNEFGIIRCDTKYEDIKVIQLMWMKWLNSLRVK
jgi:hypothetical protein